MEYHQFTLFRWLLFIGFLLVYSYQHAQLISPVEDKASFNFNDAIESSTLITINDPFELSSSGAIFSSSTREVD